LGAGLEVFVRGGRLMLRVLSAIPVLYRGFPLHPDDEEDPYIFRIDLSEFGIGTSRVVFSRNAGTGKTAAHLDLTPMSLHKQPAASNPRRWLGGALGALGVAATATGVRRRRHA
jgi:hypothetical protein